MDKLKMSTPDLTDKNVEQIGMLFPNVITEVEDGTTKDTKGHEIKKYKKVVDFDLLRQMLSKNLVEDDNERYRLDWPGKKASLLKANTPITKTLRPCLKDSSGKDGTPGKFDSENLYIEGDNFEVLKILQESYLGKIKMIYIDPPYNTGNDFIYKDNFAKSKDEYEEELGTTDEEGGRLFRNTDSNGRYHSDWLSMMYERLIVARDLLKDDGVIFISIDDNEVHNLRKICDEVFGEINLVSDLVWKSGRTAASHYTNEHEYILCYSRNKQQLPLFEYSGSDLISDRAIKKPSNKNPVSIIDFPAGIDFECEDKVFPNKFGESEPVIVKDGKFESKNGKLLNNVSIEAAWTMKDMILSWLNGEEVIDQKGQKVKRFFFKNNGVLQYEKEKGTIHPKSIIEGYSTKQGGNEISNLFGVNYFEFPKPPGLIYSQLEFVTQPNDIILDFFSGSATTAHAVMQLNAEELAEEFTTKDTKSTKKEGEEDETLSDVSSVSWLKKGKRKFIMVQLPEPCDENSEAFKAGYKTIAEIGKERIRRAGKKILEEATTKNTKGTKKENNENSMFDLDKSSESLSNVSSVSWLKNLDIGFRVYKTDSTNMKDVFYHPNELKQDFLDKLESNIKEDRTPEDLLTQVILDLGLELTLPIETKQILGNTVFIVQTNALVACFDKDIDFNIVDTISDLKPLKVVFKDASFKDDKDRINVEERFKRLSPETKVTVI